MATTLTTLGRTRGNHSVWPASLAIGIAVAGAAAALVLLLRPADPGAGLLAVVLAVILLPQAAALGWALVVDRRTLRGAVARPEHSIESEWFQKAAAGAFFDLLAICGLAGAAFQLVPVLAPVTAGWPLVALAAIAMSDFGVRYLVASRRAN